MFGVHNHVIIEAHYKGIHLETRKIPIWKPRPGCVGRKTMS